MDTLKLPRHIVNQILAHAQSAPEAEVCGLIGARNGSASHCYPVINDAAEPSHRYQMNPANQIDAMRQMRERDESLLAIYHSHPHAPALPSATDIDEAAYREAAYLIVSLDTTGVLEMQAFRIQQQQSIPLELELI